MFFLCRCGRIKPPVQKDQDDNCDQILQSIQDLPKLGKIISNANLNGSVLIVARLDPPQGQFGPFMMRTLENCTSKESWLSLPTVALAIALIALGIFEWFVVGGVVDFIGSSCEKYEDQGRGMVLLLAFLLLLRLIKYGPYDKRPSRFRNGLKLDHIKFEKDHPTRWKITAFWYWITSGRCGGGRTAKEVRNDWVSRVLPWIIADLANPAKKGIGTDENVTMRASLQTNIKGQEKSRDKNNFTLFAKVVRGVSCPFMYCFKQKLHDEQHVQLYAAADGNCVALVEFLGDAADDVLYIMVVVNQFQNTPHGVRVLCCRSGSLAKLLSKKKWMLLLDLDREVASKQSKL